MYLKENAELIGVLPHVCLFLYGMTIGAVFRNCGKRDYRNPLVQRNIL